MSVKKERKGTMKLSDVTPDVTIKTDDKPVVAPSTTTNEDTDDKVSASSPDDTDDKKGAETSGGEELPWHKDKRFKADLGLLKSAKAIMEANDVEDFSDLIEMIEAGKRIKGKKIDLNNIDKMAEDSERLAKYEAYWAQQKEMQRRQEEEPDDTIKRLEAQLNALKSKDEAKAAAEQQAIAARRAVEFYERTVSEILEDKEDNP